MGARILRHATTTTTLLGLLGREVVQGCSSSSCFYIKAAVCIEMLRSLSFYGGILHIAIGLFLALHKSNFQVDFLWISSANKARHVRVVTDYNHWVSVRKDPEAWARAMFAKDGSFTNANNPAAIGYGAIAAGAKGIYRMVSAINLTSTSIIHLSADKFMSEGTVAYVTLEGVQVEPIPIIAFFTLVPRTTLIQTYRSYIDKTPLVVAAGYDVVADPIYQKPTLVKRKIS